MFSFPVTCSPHGSGPREIRDLTRRVRREHPRWGAPRIHDELLKLGIEVSQATASKSSPDPYSGGYITRTILPHNMTDRDFATYRSNFSFELVLIYLPA